MFNSVVLDHIRSYLMISFVFDCFWFILAAFSLAYCWLFAIKFGQIWSFLTVRSVLIILCDRSVVFDNVWFRFCLVLCGQSWSILSFLYRFSQTRTAVGEWLAQCGGQVRPWKANLRYFPSIGSKVNRRYELDLSADLFGFKNTPVHTSRCQGRFLIRSGCFHFIFWSILVVYSFLGGWSFWAEFGRVWSVGRSW